MSDLAPERKPLDPRWLHPVVAVLAVYLLSWVGSWSGIPPWLMAAVGLAAIPVGFGLARHYYPEERHARTVVNHSRWLAWACGMASAAWLAYATQVGPLHALGLLVLGLLVLGGWYFTLRTHHRKDGTPMHPTGTPTPGLDQLWTTIFAKAKLPGLKAVTVTETLAGVTIVARPDAANPIGVGEVANRAKDIARHAAFVLPEHELTEDSVRPEADDHLPNLLVHVSTKRPLRGNIPYVPSPAPTDINRPLDLGIYETGERMLLKLAGVHGKYVGMTGSGKSVLANDLIGRITETSNAVVWACGTDKLVVLTYPWLRPWFAGESSHPVIDWAAGEQISDVLTMLAAAYQAMKWRNSRLARNPKHVATIAEPAIIVLIEEAGDTLSILRRKKTKMFDGRWMTGSQIVAEIGRAGRSANVSAHKLAQSNVYDALGEAGDLIARNDTLRVALMTMSVHDGTSTLPGLPGSVDTTRLRDHTLMVQPSLLNPRVHPAKAYHLEGDAVYPIAARQSAWRPSLEPALVAALGDDYAGRWDSHRLPELVDACRVDGFGWPITDVTDPVVDAEIVDPYADQADTGYVNTLRVPDITDDLARLDEIKRRAERGLPSPLKEIMDLLGAPNAPRDWVPTVELARVLDRDHSDDGANTLGRELSALVPNLRSTDPRALSPELQRVHGPGKRRGYDVRRLRQAVRALQVGRELAPE